MMALSVFDADGRQTADLGSFGNIQSARQAMLDHAEIYDLPNEIPWHGPESGVLEGWFIGRNEYLIRNK